MPPNGRNGPTTYRDVIGLELPGRIFRGCGAMLTGGRTHHELLLLQVGEAPGPLTGAIGLYRVARKVGESLDALRCARERAEAGVYTIDGLAEHTVNQSIYLRDPDGNEVELYVDDPSVDWRSGQDWMREPVKSLVL